MQIHGVAVDAAALDLDGVITQTARVHAKAWKAMFDDYFERLRESAGEDHQPMSTEDYRRYVDGKPRYEGVRSLLESRGIEIPYGSPDDDPEGRTVCALGNRKNQIFHRLISEGGVEVYQDAVEWIRQCRAAGLKTAVVSSSKNCRAVLQAAGLEDLFDVRVDGVVAEQEGLAGKPHADIFLRAAERLGVEPARAAVFEDAVAGVQAGRAGNFGLVVGVARSGQGPQLKENGAHLAVTSFDELESNVARLGAGGASRPPSALERFDEIRAQLSGARPAVFLDYDGTLTPIVSRPEDAALSAETRKVVQRLASLGTVAIVSGRDRKDVEGLVGLDALIYAGSHGFDIRGPGLRHEHEGGVAALGDLDAAEQALKDQLGGISGVRVERKRFALAVHYRNVAGADVGRVKQTVDEVNDQWPGLRQQGGKKIFEFRPDIDWDKGKALAWLLEVLGLVDRVPVYLGDDETDEDAFRAVAEDGIGIIVNDPVPETAARYSLRDTDETRMFLTKLVDLIGRTAR